MRISDCSSDVGSSDLIRVIVVDHDGIVAGYYGPALDTRHNGRFPIAKSIWYFFFYGTYKLGTDDALVNKLIPRLEFTLSVPLRHPRGGAGTAWRPVDGLVAVKHGVPGGRSGVKRGNGPLDMAQSADIGVFRIDRKSTRLNSRH